MILEGHVLDRLRELPDRAVQCCITSPPYLGLRSYSTGAWVGGDDDCDHALERGSRSDRPPSGLTGGTTTVDVATLRPGLCACGAQLIEPTIWGGDVSCEHAWGPLGPAHHPGQVPDGKSGTGAGRDNSVGQNSGSGSFCERCGAWRGQLGLEPSLDLYVEHLVDVFREVRRVLRDDGVLWLNLGDSYNAQPAGNRTPSGFSQNPARWDGGAVHVPRGEQLGCKPKDLIGVPWAVAFALRADGWYLRDAIVWAKPSCMPESVTDRCTQSYEMVFMLAKSRSYFYDQDSIREPLAVPVHAPGNVADDGHAQSKLGSAVDEPDRPWGSVAGRNKRNVWTVNTQPYAGAHFATFPVKLIEPMILAGSSPQACAECGAPWERLTERLDRGRNPIAGRSAVAATGGAINGGTEMSTLDGLNASTVTVGWQPTCSHSDMAARYERGEPARHGLDGAAASGASDVGQFTLPRRHAGWRTGCAHNDDSGRCVVLDPFAGSGTVGVVAEWHGRDFIGVELSAEYAELARQRIEVEGRLRRSPYRPEPLPDEQATLW